MAKEKTQVYFIRHGFNPANNAGYSGQRGIRKGLCSYDEFMPLDENGITQARETGEFMSTKISGKKTLFLVSPYYRTRQTAYELLLMIPDEAKSQFQVVIENPLREINQGMEYAEPRISLEELESASTEQIEMFANDQLRKDYAKKGYDAEEISYLYGESTQDVTRRLRKFSKDLKRVIESNDYDAVVIVSHNTVTKSLYALLTGEKLTKQLHTGSVLQIDGLNPLPDDEQEIEKHYFKPHTFVEKGYAVDFSKFDNYSKLLDMQLLIEEYKSNPLFNQFWGERKTTMPIEEQCFFIEKGGECLVILPNNNEKKGYFYIDAPIGQDRITLDKKSKSTYFVLSGKCKFYTKNNKTGEFNAKTYKAGDIVEIQPNTTFYYESIGNINNPKDSLKLIEKMEPNFAEENIVDFGPTPYFQHKEMQ